MDEMTQNQTGEILGELSKQLFTLKEDNRRLKNLEKINNKLLEPIQLQILEIMENQGLDKFGTIYGGLTRKIDVHPNITDFIKFINWAVKARAYEFLQRRINAAPVREMLKDTNTLPPGVDTFLKEGLLARIKSEFRAELEKGEQ